MNQVKTDMLKAPTEGKKVGNAADFSYEKCERWDARLNNRPVDGDVVEVSRSFMAIYYAMRAKREEFFQERCGAVGFVLDATALRPYVDESICIPAAGEGTYDASHGMDAPAPLVFVYAQAIEVHFDAANRIADGDALVFYSDAAGREPVRSFSGHNWPHAFTFEGNTLYYRFIVKSTAAVPGHVFFSARPTYVFTTERHFDTNAQQFLRSGDRAFTALKDLLLIDAKEHSDTLRFAALAFHLLVLAADTEQSLSISNKRRTNRAAGAEADERASPCNFMMQFNSLELARTLAKAEDHCVARVGAVSVLQLLQRGGPNIEESVMAERMWEPLRQICITTAQSHSPVQQDACRASLAAIRFLARNQENHAELTQGNVFTPLMKCLESDDSIVRSGAAEALFQLSENPANRTQLLRVGLNFLVTASTQRTNRLSTTPDAVSTNALKDGAMTVLCKLATSDRFGAGEALAKALDGETRLAKAMAIAFEDVSTLLQRATKGQRDVIPRALMSRAAALEKIGQCMARRADEQSFGERLGEVIAAVSAQEDEWLAVLDMASRVLAPPRLLSRASMSDADQADLLDLWGSSIFKHAQSDAFYLSLVNALLNFSKNPHSLLIAAKAGEILVTVAKFLWSTRRITTKSAFAKLAPRVVTEFTAVLRDNDMWLTVIAAKRTPIERILDTAISVFDTISYDQGSHAVLDMMQALCSLRGAPVALAQQMIFKRLVAPTSRAQFFFRQSDAGRLQLSSTRPKEPKVWRELELFYLYEPRGQLRRFLASTLSLWAALTSGGLPDVLAYFRRFLSFEQLVRAINWPFREKPPITVSSSVVRQDCRLDDKAGPFVLLVNNLYVDVDEGLKFTAGNVVADLSVSEDGYTSVKDGQRRYQSVLSEPRVQSLRLLVNEFVGSGAGLNLPGETGREVRLQRMIVRMRDAFLAEQGSQGPPGGGAGSVGGVGSFEGEKRFGFAPVMMKLALSMVEYGMYADVQAAQELSLGLIDALRKAPLESLKFISQLEANKNFLVQTQLSMVRILRVLHEVQISLAHLDLSRIAVAKWEELRASSGALDFATEMSRTLRDKLSYSADFRPRAGDRVLYTVRSPGRSATYRGSVVLNQGDDVRVAWDHKLRGAAAGGSGGGPPEVVPLSDARLLVDRFASLKLFLLGDARNYGAADVPGSAGRLRALRLSKTIDALLQVASKAPPVLSAETWQLIVERSRGPAKLLGMARRLVFRDASTEAGNLFPLVERAVAELRAAFSAGDPFALTGIEADRLVHGMSRLAFMLEGATVGNTPVKGMRVVQGPDWSSTRSEEAGLPGGDDGYRGKIVAVTEADGGSSECILTVKWKQRDGAWRDNSFRYAFGKGGRYEVAIRKRPARRGDAYAQSLAFSLGLFDVLEKLAARGDALLQAGGDLSTDQSELMRATYRLLAAAAENNGPLQVHALSGRLMQTMAEHLRTLGSERALASLFGNAESFSYVSSDLVERLIRLVATGQADMMDVLLSTLPEADAYRKVEYGASGDAARLKVLRSKRREAQSLVVQSLLRREGAAESMVLATLRSAKDEDSAKQIGLANLLARACDGNPEMTALVKRETGLTLPRLIQRADEVRRKTVSFVKLARSLTPWVQLLTVYNQGRGGGEADDAGSGRRRLFGGARALSPEEREEERAAVVFAEDLKRYISAHAAATIAAAEDAAGGDAARRTVSRQSVGCGEGPRGEYDNNTRAVWFVRLDGAPSIKVAFDPRSSTEANCDSVGVHKWPPVVEDASGLTGHRFHVKQEARLYESALSAESNGTLPGGTEVLVAENMEWASGVGEDLDFLPAADAEQHGSMRMQLLQPAHVAGRWIEWRHTDHMVPQNAEGEDDEVTWHSRYSGSTGNWPTSDKPLVVRDDKFYVTFTTDGSNTDWGWRLSARAAEPGDSADDEEAAAEEGGPQLVERMQADPAHAAFESAHEYANSTKQYLEVVMPGAERLEVVFDPRSSTEQGYDFLRVLRELPPAVRARREAAGGAPNELFSDNESPPDQLLLLDEKLHGGRGGSNKVFPGVERPPLYVNSDRFALYWETDSSNTDWGWRFFVRPVRGAFANFLDSARCFTGTLSLEKPDGAAPEGSGQFECLAERVPLSVAPGGASGGKDDEEEEDDDEFDENMEELRRGAVVHVAERREGPKGDAWLRLEVQSPVWEHVGKDEPRREAKSIRPLWAPERSAAGELLLGLAVPEERSVDLRLPADDAGDGLRLLFDAGAGAVDPADSVLVSAVRRDGSLTARSENLAGRLPTGEPLAVRGKHLRVTYRRRAATSRGPVLAGAAASVPFDALALGNFMGDAGKFVVLESGHPYNDNMDESHEVHVEGAAGLVCWFAPETSTEARHDYIELRLDNPSMGGSPDHAAGGRRYTGGMNGTSKNFPGVNGEAPLSVAADRLWLHFVSDGSNSDWGYKFIAVDKDHYNAVVEENLEADEETPLAPAALRDSTAGKIFPFFKNATDAPVTVRLDLPCERGRVFYEATVGERQAVDEVTDEGGENSSRVKDCVLVGLVSHREGQLRESHAFGPSAAIALGSTNASWAVDACGLGEATRHWGGEDTTWDESALFSPGSVVGFLVDFDRGEMKVFVDGRELELAFSRRDHGAFHWSGGLCPAFTLSPGQSISVNAGQYGNFATKAAQGQGASGFVDSFTAKGTGALQLYNPVWQCWDEISASDGLLENALTDDVSRYVLTLQNYFASLRGTFAGVDRMVDETLSRNRKVTLAAESKSSYSHSYHSFEGGEASFASGGGAATGAAACNATALAAVLPRLRGAAELAFQDAIHRRLIHDTSHPIAYADATIAAGAAGPRPLDVWVLDGERRVSVTMDKARPWLRKPRSGVPLGAEEEAEDAALAELLARFKDTFEGEVVARHAESTGAVSAVAAVAAGAGGGAAIVGGGDSDDIAQEIMSSITGALTGIAGVVGDIETQVAQTITSMGGVGGAAAGADHAGGAGTALVADAPAAAAAAGGGSGWRGQRLGDLERLVDSVVRPGCTREHPRFCVVVAKLLRLLGSNVDLGPDKLDAALAAEQPSSDARDVDSFKTEREKYTLRLVQDVLVVNFKAVPMACKLMEESGNREMQVEGCRLASFLMQNLNTRAQRAFVDHLSGAEHAVRHLVSEGLEVRAGVAVLDNIAGLVADFHRAGKTLRGRARLVMLDETREAFRFLQHLVDGQMLGAQTLLREHMLAGGGAAPLAGGALGSAADTPSSAATAAAAADAGAPASAGEAGRTILDLTVETLEVLHGDYETRQAWHADIEDELSTLSLAEQILNAASDYVQGPVRENQVRLVEAGLFSWCARWSELVSSVSERLKAKESASARWPGAGAARAKFSTQRVRAFVEGDAFRKYSALREAEEASMLTVYSMLEGLSAEHMGPLLKFLGGGDFDPRRVIERFRMFWQELMFDDNMRERVLQKGRGLGRAAAGGPGGADDGPLSLAPSSSFSGAAAAASPAAEEHARRLQQFPNATDAMWYAMSLAQPGLLEATADQAVRVAFSYYVTIQSAIGAYAQLDLRKRLERGDMDTAREWERLWSTRSLASRDCIISASLATQMDTYFGSIEIINKEGNLQQIFFPLPTACRAQINNPLVERERVELMDSVNRENPEEKLDNFLDLSISIEHVIQHQHQILTHHSMRSVIKFLTTRENLWVILIMGVTVTINLLLLLNAQNGHSKAQAYLDEDIHTSVRYLGFAHVALSCIMLIVYVIGSAQITLNNGNTVREAIRKRQLPPPEGLSGTLYEAMELIPVPPLKALLWGAIDLVKDFKSVYYAIFLVFSVLGIQYSVAFYAFHILDIATRVKILRSVIQAVAEPIDQVLATLVLGVLLTYVYAVLGVFLYGFNAYEYGDGGGGWYSLSESFLQHLDFGLRGPPVFDGSGTAAVMTAGKYAIDISYNIVIILIMVAVITGTLDAPPRACPKPQAADRLTPSLSPPSLVPQVSSSTSSRRSATTVTLLSKTSEATVSSAACRERRSSARTSSLRITSRASTTRGTT